MPGTLGFFDVDSLEYTDSDAEPQSVVPGFSFRERVRPIGLRLNRLHQYALSGHATLVLTTCCSGRALPPGIRNDLLYLPLEEEDDSWVPKAAERNLVYVQKKVAGNPQDNYKQECFLVFKHNRQIAKYLEVSGIRDWVVFGNGFEICCSNVAESLLACGCRVTVLPDTAIQSAKGYGLSGTPEGKLAVIDELTAQGAVMQTYGEFCLQHAIPEFHG